MQAITLLIVLTIVSFEHTTPGNPDHIAALDVPSIVEPQPISIEPLPPRPTPLLQQHLLDNPPTPAPQSGTTAGLEPALLPQPTALNFRGAEITQGIQVFQEPESLYCEPYPDHPNFIFCNNSVPMVAGRHTLIRAYLACAEACPATETVVRLRLLKDGQEQASLTRQLPAEALPRLTHLPMPQLRSNLDNSVNFEFFPPPAWLSGQITFELEAQPQGEAQKSPARLSFTKDFVERNPLRVAYLPIDYKGLRPPDPMDVDYWLQRMYPVPDVEYYRLPIPDLTWEGEVSKGEILRQLLYTYWLYAQSQPSEARPDQLFGWLPQELYNGGASDPFWCPNCAGPHSSRVAFGGLRPEQDIGGPRILAHEIAHNLGAQHAWSPTSQEDTACFKAVGADIQVDPEWPYSMTPYIQEFGIDLYSDPPVIYPPSYYDMMAYCAQPWISPHTYRKIFDSPFLKPDTTDSLALSAFQPQVESSPRGTLLVSGVVYPDGSVSRPEVIRLEGDAFGQTAAGFAPPLEFAPPPGDDYCLEIQAKDGAILSQYCFDAGFLDLESGQPMESSPFFLTLPGIDVDNIEQVTLQKNRVVLTTVSASNHPPEVTVNFPNGGERLDGAQTITWEARDADGDPLLYDIFYSPDAGQSWLPLAVRLTRPDYTFNANQVPASSQALIRVMASDGFDAAMDESNGLFAIETLPANSVSLVGPETVEPGQTFEVAVVAHEVTAPGLFGVQFELSFDPGQVQVDSLHANAALNLVIAETIQNDRGRLSFAASRRGQLPNLTGQVTLALIRLTATQSEDQIYLSLHNVIAGARGGLPLAVSEIRGLSLRVAR